MLVPHTSPRPLPLLERWMDGYTWLPPTYFPGGDVRATYMTVARLGVSDYPRCGSDLHFRTLDTTVLGQQGDLDGGPAHHFLMQLARRGWIGCNVTGPPCETWSAARHMPKPSHIKGRWPRPLRSSSTDSGAFPIRPSASSSNGYVWGRLDETNHASSLGYVPWTLPQDSAGGSRPTSKVNFARQARKRILRA